MDYNKLFDKNLIIAKTINEAREERKSGTKCVAIYLYNKKIVSIGINKNKTHPIIYKYKEYIDKYFFE